VLIRHDQRRVETRYDGESRSKLLEIRRRGCQHCLVWLLLAVGWVSLAVRTARSAVWMLVGKIVAAVSGVIGTIIVLGLLDRGHNGTLEYGEATAAYLVVATAAQITTLGVGQFVVVKGEGRGDLAFLATSVHVALGLVAAVAVYACREPLGAWIGAPGMGRFVAGFAIAMMFDRISLIPERVLIRAFRMRTVALTRTGADLVFLAVSIALAALGWGGMAIVVGNIARSGTRMVVQCAAVERRDWLDISPLRADALRELWRFSGPLWIGNVAGFACRRWDNLLVSRFYGAGVMGSYNVAYNLAENPPVVAEQAIDALFPSYTRLEPHRRVPGLLRSLALLSLITSPLVIGLGAVAPTVVEAFLDPSRSDVTPMLVILSVMSVTRPLVWGCAAYFLAIDRTRLVMILDVANLVALVVAIVTLGRVSPLWACAAVGLVSMIRAIITGLVVCDMHGLRLHTFFGPQLRPVLACLPMVAAVLVVRQTELGSTIVQLVVEVLAGAIGYVAGAWVIANATCRDALDLARRSFQTRTPS
jgi:PST family polysaccharide transporter